MKNIRQTLAFPVFVFAPETAPKELLNKILEIPSAISKGESPVSIQEKKDLLLQMLPDNVKNTCQEFGVVFPFEKADVTLELGQLLLDLYVCGAVAPESPLQKRAFERRLGELSEKFTQENIECPAYAKDVIRKVMEDPELWKKTNAHVFVEVEGKKKFFVISNKGLDFFINILNALMDELENG